MQLFYCENISEDRARFGKDESFHAVKVLRMRSGDTIMFTDGKGSLFQGRVTSDNATEIQAEITGIIRKEDERPYRLHIAISPLKNNDRYEWFVEKAVEIGIDEITPLICDRTEKQAVREARLNGLIISAVKQSVKLFKPQLNRTMTLRDFLSLNNPGRRLIATCSDEFARTAVTESFGKGEIITVLIGPEGDFTQNEIEAAITSGYLPVHFGPSRMRTETAGVTACCSVYLKNI